jgi:hypothetical protein
MAKSHFRIVTIFSEKKHMSSSDNPVQIITSTRTSLKITPNITPICRDKISSDQKGDSWTMYMHAQPSAPTPNSYHSQHLSTGLEFSYYKSRDAAKASSSDC